MSDSCPGYYTNFSHRNDKKPQTRIEIEKIPEVKLLIKEHIEKDFIFWKDKGLKQFGIEKYNLLKKVSMSIKINSDVFELALDDLIMDQEIIPVPDGNFIRYIKLGL